MRIEKHNINKKGTVNKRLITVLIILICIILIFSIGYARYITTINGEASQDIAEMICNMEVVPSEKNSTIINPYCIVTVKNYNSDDKVTETDVNYTIEVTPKEDFVMPEYYWEDSSGKIVARSTVLSGNFKNQEKRQDEYKIVFINSGEKDVTGLVEFNLTAIQEN